MKIKKEYLILAFIIVALSAYLALHKSDRSNYELPNIEKIESKQITKIEIIKSDKTITLIHNASEWEIDPQGFVADNNKVADLLDVIDDFTLTALVSESESYNRYDLDDQNKIVVKAWVKDNLKREFVIGKAAPSYRHTFVKLSNDKRVFHARDNFRGKFSKNIDDLRDKTVLSFTKADILEVSILQSDIQTTFNHKQIPVQVNVNEKNQENKQPSMTSVWQDSDGNQVKEDSINKLLDALKLLKCEKYINDTTKESMQNPLCKIILKGAKEYSLSVFNKKDEKDSTYPAISSESDYVFELSGYKFDNTIIKTIEDLIKKQEKL